MAFEKKKLIKFIKNYLLKVGNKEHFQPVIDLGKNIISFGDKTVAITKRSDFIQNLSFYNQTNKSYESTNTTVDTNETKQKSIFKQQQKWKQVLSKEKINLEVLHILEAISEAETELSLQNRVQALILYINRQPEATIIAAKNGAIRILLNVRKKNKNKDQSAIREALALLGYSDPIPGKGIRILSIDGGGIRGLLVLEMLKKLEELTGKRTYELFDLLCGTSTGAILAFSIGVFHRSLEEIGQIYQDISNEVFKQSTIRGTGNLVWSQSYYNTSLWEKKLLEHMGECKLSETARDPLCPKICSVSTVVNQANLLPYLFRNYSLPWKIQSQYIGSSSYKVWEAVRASAAAPTYFEEFKLGDYIHQDGGLLVNNPTAIAVHEAKLIWPTNPIQCVVSFGTGRTVPLSNEEKVVSNYSANTSWKSKFYNIVDSATDTEGVHTMLNDLLLPGVYYRFNPYLTEMISMVEIDSLKLGQLKRDALMYLRRNEDKFKEAAISLITSKNLFQKSKDWIDYKRELFEI